MNGHLSMDYLTAGTAFLLLVAAGVFEAVFLFRRDGRQDTVSPWLLLAASLLLFLNLILRSFRIDFIALTGVFESLIFFAGSLGIVLFLYRRFSKEGSLRGITFGGTVIAVALLAAASSPLAPREIQPPIPALQSGWLILHVSFSFIGEAFFAVAFIASLYSFFTGDAARLKVLDRTTYTSIGIGYPIFTAGALAFGAIWAEYAWGSWWSWDPKETWALVTWLVYTAYLHGRLVRKWSRKTTALLSVAGFIFTLFTFFGVNYLLPGLHSYR